MPKDFSVNSVRELKDIYSKLFEDMSVAVRLQEKTKGLVSAKIKSLLMRGIFANFAQSEFAFGISLETEQEKFADLIQQLAIYMKISPVAQYSNEIAKIRDKLTRQLDEISPATGNIRWFFVSSSKKNEIKTLYKRLYDILESGFEEQVNDIKTSAEKIAQTTQQEAISDFRDNKAVYFETLTSIAGKNIVQDKCCIPQVITLLQKYDNYKKLRDGIQAKITDAEISVRKAVDSVLLQTAMSVLRDVPLEELNREKLGIRIKPLQDYGYNSVADVYSATVYNLASISGISYANAHLIKRVAADIFNKTLSSAKLKLSVDNKTLETTGLVCALYVYRKKKLAFDKINELYSLHGHKISAAISYLQRIGNGVQWLFWAGSDKRNAIASYEYLMEIEGVILEAINSVRTSRDTYYRYNESDAWNDFSQNSIEYFNTIETLVPGAIGSSDSVYGLPEELARDIQDEAYFPEGLTCTLRRYQEWGVKYILHQERVLLGDEMGLGKTVQAIATMVSLKNIEEKHFIVVCPASVLTNWCKEISNKSKLRVTKIHGADKYMSFSDWKQNGGVAVTTYETVSIFNFAKKFRFGLLVVDEAHYVKNPLAQRTQNIKQLITHTDRLLFMTGTALENRVEEMIALIGMLQPQVAQNVEKYSYMAASKQFREMAAPVYYRRKREDVLTELPELIDIKDWCIMTAEDEAEYENTLFAGTYPSVRRVSWNVDNWDNSSKAQRMLEIIEEAAADGRKTLVFSFFLDTLDRIAEMLGTRCVGVINGSVKPQIRQNIVDTFEEAPEGSVLVAQIQSGGVGLNIQAASVVIICEPQFKPSIENQAISRAYRMGQTRNVLVHHLLCENSVDEKIAEMLESKQRIFDEFADKSVAAEAVKEQAVEIDTATFGQIIKEEIDRINKEKEQENIDDKPSDKITDKIEQNILDKTEEVV